jgi:hypothetical protein
LHVAHQDCLLGTACSSIRCNRQQQTASAHPQAMPLPLLLLTSLVPMLLQQQLLPRVTYY